MDKNKETGLTTEDAATLLGVSPYQVRQLCRERQLPFYQIGSNRYLFRRSTLLRFIEEQEQRNVS